jgi:ATP synthase subunit G
MRLNVLMGLFQEREHQFKEYEQQYLGTKEDIEAGIVRETEAELAAMKKNVAENKQQVIVRLLQLVCRIGFYNAFCSF